MLATSQAAKISDHVVVSLRMPAENLVGFIDEHYPAISTALLLVVSMDTTVVRHFRRQADCWITSW
jgi:hypothetical protein